ncbi:uncharacterized protein LOC132180095 [Corylus avellana]|nr:uncharacterized protein LOC132180095 [Corylus avellana]
MKHFYIPPDCDIAAIKRDAFLDMRNKHTTWRYELKKSLHITSDDTPATVKAREGGQLSTYNREDVDILLEIWCTAENQEYAAYMKGIRSKNKEPHCTGSKSYARATHEEKINTGVTPTRAQSYIKTHEKKTGGYPNDLVAEKCERMKELLPTDSAATQSVTEGTVRWAPDDAYAQGMGNKPEYAGRVRQVGAGILPVRGSIHSYYRPVAPRSQPPGSSGVPELIETALQVEREKHKQEMDALQQTQREQATEQQAERERHRAEIAALLDAQRVEVEQQVAVRLAETRASMTTMYEARFRQLEHMFKSSSSSDTTRVKDVTEKESPARLVVKSLVGSEPGIAEKLSNEEAIDLD